MQKNIEPCPCCYSDTETGDNWDYGQPYVRCVSCGLLMQGKTIEDAIKKWNRRYAGDQCGWYDVKDS